MKIAIVLPQPPGYSETFFRSKIEGLQESGHKVILVTASTKHKFDACQHLQHPKVSKNNFVQVFKMLTVFISLLPYLKRIIKFIQLERKEESGFKNILEKIYINATLLKLKSDWLHFGFATMAIDRELAAKAIGAKLAVSFRGYDIGVYPLKHPNCYDKLWKHLDQVHYISNDLYQKAIKLGLPKSINHLKITPAINLDFFRKKTDQSSSSASKKISICSIGRLHWKKGFVDTIQALYFVKQEGIDFVYNIIGEGNEYERIAFVAYQLGLQNQVKFLGKLEHKQVKEELMRADLYLQYSIQEGFCNSVLEAQALGKLCIVSDAEGLSENVLNNTTGWVVPRLSPKLLAKKIQEIIALPEVEKEKISRNAMQRVKNEFNLEKQRQEFNEFYTQLS